MVHFTLYNIKTRTKIQLDTFSFLFLCFCFGVYVIRFIYMFIVKEILFTRVIYAANLYHHSERDIPNFCMTWVLLWFDKGYTNMVSSARSYSNEYFPYLRHIIHPFFLQACVSCAFPGIILGLSEIQCKWICTSAWMS